MTYDDSTPTGTPLALTSPTRRSPQPWVKEGTAMKAYSTRAFVVVAVSTLLVVWASRLPACTGATARSNLPEFRALTSFVVI